MCLLSIEGVCQNQISNSNNGGEKMKLIFCLDKNNGMLFAGKRQSRDSILYEELLKRIGECKLWISSYSASLFPQMSNIIISLCYNEYSVV